MEQVPRLVCEYVRQGHDPLQMYQGKRIEYSDSLVSDFPNSPTALKYKAAYEMFQKARLILDQYTKAEVDTESDCNFLQPVFQGYSKAYMCDNLLYDRFKPPDNTPELVDQYLKHRLDDILSEFCKHIFVTKSHHIGNEFSKFKHVQMAIRTYEMFAMKVQEAETTSEIRRQILNTLFTRLGSLYSTTEQRLRAIDSFQKAYDNDHSDHESLFGVAWWFWHDDPAKAIKLIHKYLNSAPECHRKYYDAYYTLSLIYIKVYSNVAKAKAYFDKGMNAEKNQLPFIPIDETPSKTFAKIEIERLSKM